jgi:fatty acid desaturase
MREAAVAIHAVHGMTIASLRVLDPLRTAWAIAWRGWLLLAALALGIAGPVWAAPAAVALIGIVQYHFVILSHEAQHLLVARRRGLNDAVGVVLAWPFGQPFFSERARHFAHHRLVGGPDDPDWPRYVLDGKRPWRALLRYYARMAAFGKALEYVRSVIRPHAAAASADRRSGWEVIAVLAAQGAVLFAFAAVSSPWHYLAFWAAPIWLVAAPLSEFREFCEHVSAPGTPARLKTFRPPAWERFVLGPVDFFYHAEHHLYPSIPHYRLKDVFPLLSDEERAGIEVRRSYLDVVVRCA